MPLARICSSIFTALLPVLTACGSELVLPDSGGSPSIQVVGGNGQNGEVGALLSEPVKVLVTDAAGNPLANAVVEFQLISAGEGGEISPDTTTTDGAGQAEAHLVLGDKVGIQTGEAHLLVDGATASKASFSAIASAVTPENRSPTADFNWHCEQLSCQFTDASSDPDGSISVHAWQFGDGSGSDQADPQHVYSAPGSYTVTLTVTDDRGASDQTYTEISVTSSPPPPANEPPRAEFEVHCHDQVCSFIDKSEDNDGSVVSWSWNFGDGSSSDQRNPIHSYEEEGHYDVTLTITDDGGASDSKTHEAKPKD